MVMKTGANYTNAPATCCRWPDVLDHFDPISLCLLIALAVFGIIVICTGRDE